MDTCKTRRHILRYADICGYTLMYVHIRGYVQGETYRATAWEEVRSMQCVCSIFAHVLAEAYIGYTRICVDISR